MAFNLQTFKTRALSAIVFAAIMLAGLFWNEWSFIILFTIIHFGCWTEYQKLVGKIDPDYTKVSSFHKNSIMIAGFALMLWFTNESLSIGEFPIHAIGWWVLLIFLFILPIGVFLFENNMSLKTIRYSFAGLIYISFSWGLMMELRSMEHYGLQAAANRPWLVPVLLISSIWINDTMAYLVGSFIGKTPLSPISPKKTWEGTLGGAILCVLIIFCLAYFLFQVDWPTALAIPAVAAVFGTLGDLLESKLKRMADVKDSGNMMPGHGGFLDRFDSLLIATPFVWLVLMWLH